MKTITVDEFISFGPCWLKDEASRRKIKHYAAIKNEWSALDILELEGVDADEKLWLVLRPELLSDTIIREFSCWCGENALSIIPDPDQRSIDGIIAKRKWLRGEISDEELEVARVAAREAAGVTAGVTAGAAAREAAGDAAGAAAGAAAREAAWDAWDAWDAARAMQVSMLIKMIREDEAKDAEDKMVSAYLVCRRELRRRI